MTRVPRQTGHSLAGVMIFLMLVMLLWVGAARQLACHLRLSKAREVHRQKSTKCRQAMAWALSLLETGRPPEDSGDKLCIRRMIIEGETYVVTYKRHGEEYDVEVRPKMSEDDDVWPLVPDSF